MDFARTAGFARSLKPCMAFAGRNGKRSAKLHATGRVGDVDRMVVHSPHNRDCFGPSLLHRFPVDDGLCFCRISTLIYTLHVSTWCASSLHHESIETLARCSSIRWLHLPHFRCTLRNYVDCSAVAIFWAVADLLRLGKHHWHGIGRQRCRDACLCAPIGVVHSKHAHCLFFRVASTHTRAHGGVCSPNSWAGIPQERWSHNTVCGVLLSCFKRPVICRAFNRISTTIARIARSLDYRISAGL